MNRRQFLVQIAAIAAATVLPLQAVVRRGGDIAREVARFSQGTLRFVPSKSGFAPNAFTGGGALGWIENMKGIPHAWVDKAQRIHWDGGDITRVFQR